MPEPRKRCICRVTINGAVLTFPPSDTATVPHVVAAAAMAFPPPVITIEWEEAPNE